VSFSIFTYISVTVRLTTSPSLEFACPVQYFTRAVRNSCYGIYLRKTDAVTYVPKKWAYAILAV
jgi:hypothetical protein